MVKWLFIKLIKGRAKFKLGSILVQSHALFPQYSSSSLHRVQIITQVKDVEQRESHFLLTRPAPLQPWSSMNIGEWSADMMELEKKNPDI